MRRRGAARVRSIAVKANKAERAAAALGPKNVTRRCICDVRAQIYTTIVEKTPIGSKVSDSIHYIKSRPKPFVCAHCGDEKNGSGRRVIRDAQGERVEVCQRCERKHNKSKSEETN